MHQHKNVAKTCNIKKLVEYATREGWIRRVHEYPAITPKEDEDVKDIKTETAVGQVAATVLHLSGLTAVSSEHSIEELCATYKTNEQVRL